MKKILAVLGVALLAAFSTSNVAYAKTCENEVFATGNAFRFKTQAYFSSLWAWRREVKAIYGTKFNEWRRADRRNIDCAKGSKNGKSGWLCTRTALPCRLGGSASTPDNGGSGPLLPLPDRTLRRGDNNKDVANLQSILNEFGYNLVVDGDYGSGTVKAVKDFQKKEGLGIDGSVGPQTRSRLRELMRG